MTIKLLKTSKARGKMIAPGTYTTGKTKDDILVSKAKEWVKAGVAVEVEEKSVVVTAPPPANQKAKTSTEILEEGQLAELQAATKVLEIDTDGKTYEELLAEVELVKSMQLES